MSNNVKGSSKNTISKKSLSSLTKTTKPANKAKHKNKADKNENHLSPPDHEKRTLSSHSSKAGTSLSTLGGSKSRHNAS